MIYLSIIYHLPADYVSIYHVGGCGKNGIFELKQIRIGKIIFTFLLSNKVNVPRKCNWVWEGFLLFFFTLNHPSPLSSLSSSKPGAKLENRIMKTIKILVRNWVCHQNFPGANKPFFIINWKANCVEWSQEAWGYSLGIIAYSEELKILAVSPTSLSLGTLKSNQHTSRCSTIQLDVWIQLKRIQHKTF